MNSSCLTVSFQLDLADLPVSLCLSSTRDLGLEHPVDVLGDLCGGVRSLHGLGEVGVQVDDARSDGIVGHLAVVHKDEEQIRPMFCKGDLELSLIGARMEAWGFRVAMTPTLVMVIVCCSMASWMGLEALVLRLLWSRSHIFMIF